MLACEFFALCDRSADGFTKHPILGTVPTCRRCADHVGETLYETEAEACDALLADRPAGVR